MSENNVFYSPEGNPEIWETKPEGYFTEQEWLAVQESTLTLQDCLEELRLQKWNVKNSGIIINGINIDTDDVGQKTIEGAVISCLLDPNFTANWKTGDTNEDGTSVWMVLDKEFITVIAQAVAEYVEACFEVEAIKQTELAALSTPEEFKQWLDTSLYEGWPNNVITVGVE